MGDLKTHGAQLFGGGNLYKAVLKHVTAHKIHAGRYFDRTQFFTVSKRLGAQVCNAVGHFYALQKAATRKSAFAYGFETVSQCQTFEFIATVKGALPYDFQVFRKVHGFERLAEVKRAVAYLVGTADKRQFGKPFATVKSVFAYRSHVLAYGDTMRAALEKGVCADFSNAVGQA